MRNIRYNEEQIIAKLRKAELLFSEGKFKGEVCKALEISPITFISIFLVMCIHRGGTRFGEQVKTTNKELISEVFKTE
ncbi:hypothetical protein HBN50_11080 [Halobacteriovorax sp. GB3]|uniref:hypothetical protein n=1 Tax=Halobacteriovorax sp. GB3 TaxID=2719615 RepID=UPI0023609CB8|nr:hypothetical protein [Halobacteriovorax sp. GB3]MDD0853646.1 hypothetical protein [Halobacteriovorax sp. GB3]